MLSVIACAGAAEPTAHTCAPATGSSSLPLTCTVMVAGSVRGTARAGSTAGTVGVRGLAVG